MEIINLDENFDLTDILDDINSSSVDLNMSGGAKPTRVFNNFKAGDKTLYLAEVWEVKSVDGNDVVITKGDKEKNVSKKDLVEYEDPKTSEFFADPETPEERFEPVSPPLPEGEDDGPKTPEPEYKFPIRKVGDKVLHIGEIWEIKSLEGYNIVIKKGDEEKSVHTNSVVEYVDPNQETPEPRFEPVSPSLPEDEAEGEDYGPKTPLPEDEGEGEDEAEGEDDGPKTSTIEPVDPSKKTFSAVPPPQGLYDPPSSLTTLLDKATQPKASGVDKLPEKYDAETDIVAGVESVPDGNFVQVEKYIENITGLEYERYLGELEDFFTSSKKKKNKQNFDYLVSDKGNFEKRCKPGVDNKKDELVIIPPKYVKISDALKVINVNLDDVSFELREMRDKILLKEKGVTDTQFSALKQKFYTENDKKQIFLNYKNKINKTDETNKNILRLSLEKAELRNKLRILFNEISELNRVPNKDYSLINLKIREYIESNKINHIDREIASLKNRENIDYIVMESPKISKPSSGEASKKKRVLKKKPAVAAEDIPEPSATEEVEEKPKKKKIIRKKKTKGGSAGKINIDGLLDIVEDDINIETIETKNDNDENDLTKMISETLPEEEKVLVGGDSEIDLDLDLDLDLNEINFSVPKAEETKAEETKTVKIELPAEEINEGIEELELGDDLEELSSYEDEEMSGGNENYSFENTYKQEVPEDKIDNQIPLKLDDDTPIQVKVVKLGHETSDQ